MPGGGSVFTEEDIEAATLGEQTKEAVTVGTLVSGILMARGYDDVQACSVDDSLFFHNSVGEDDSRWAALDAVLDELQEEFSAKLFKAAKKIFGDDVQTGDEAVKLGEQALDLAQNLLPARKPPPKWDSDSDNP